MHNKDLNFARLKQQLSQHIKKIYQNCLAHEPKEITYQLFPDKLIIIMEDSVTQPERLLDQSNQQNLAKEVRSVLDQIFQPQLRELIEQSMDVKIADFLFDTTISTGRTGAIAIFELQPTTLPVGDSNGRG